MEDCNYNVASIPHELVFEILRNLPARSLMRFKCVSKSFFSLISDTLFIESHQKSCVTQFLVNRPEVSYYKLSKIEEGDEDLATCPLQYLHQPCFSDLGSIQSTNGLVCLWNHLGKVAICNPFLKQHVFLPYEQPKRMIFYAIGFDPTTKKHKVFRVVVGYRTIYSIFTIGIDKSWREISYCTKFLPANGNSVCVDGVIYFVNIWECEVVAFSVGDEKLIRRIQFPLNEWPLRFFETTPRIVETKGQVALLGHVYFECGTIVLYMLNGIDESEKWMKHKIKLPVKFKNISSQSLCCLLTINPRGDIVSTLDVEDSPLFLYDKRKEWRIVTKKRIYKQKLHVDVEGHYIYLNLVESIWSLT